MELDWSLRYNLKTWARFMEMTYNSPATSHLLVLERHQPIIHYIGGSKMVSWFNYWKRCFGKQYNKKNSYIWHVYYIVFFFCRTTFKDLIARFWDPNISTGLKSGFGYLRLCRKKLGRKRNFVWKRTSLCGWIWGTSDCCNHTREVNIFRCLQYNL